MFMKNHHLHMLVFRLLHLLGNHILPRKEGRRILPQLLRPDWLVLVLVLVRSQRQPLVELLLQKLQLLFLI
jgi:hypothetical protein